MSVIVFSDFGCTVIQENGKLFVLYDSGNSAGSHLIKQEITNEELERMKISENEAYKILLTIERRWKIT
jgi:hypothetical protein